MFKQALVELVLLTIASVGVALAANEVRERKSIELTKSYFETGKSGASKTVQAPVQTVEKETNSTAAPVALQPKDDASGRKATPPANATEKQQMASAPTKHLEHPYQRITFAEVKEVFEDPQTKQGLNVFVDARDDEHFAEGHIPGAIQCFPYEVQKCIDQVRAAADGAEKVIIYCGGGDCEDSIFMCREAIDAGVPEEAVYLFEGGWKEWSAGKMPAETGRK